VAHRSDPTGCFQGPDWRFDGAWPTHGAASGPKNSANDGVNFATMILM
jgi:hypothetical protein